MHGIWLLGHVLHLALTAVSVAQADTPPSSPHPTTNPGDSTTSDPPWELSCPLTCSCVLTDIRDLPLHRWFVLVPPENNTTDSTLHPNEALLEENLSPNSIPDFEHGVDDILRTAVCVFRQNAESQEWLKQLPRNIQYLTILQASGSGKLLLTTQQLEGFTDLVALDVQGSTEETNETNDEIVIMSDALKGLSQLHILNLQHVRFMGQPDQAPPPTTTPKQPRYSIIISEVDKSEKHWKQKSLDMHHDLVFLAPAEPVPYEEFKQDQQKGERHVLSGLRNLTLLRIFDCDLKEITWEMFDGLNQLKHLSLENNQLLFIPDFAFYGVPNIKSLSLAGNRILSIQFTGLAGLMELEKLDLSRNNLTHLSELSLPPFPKLATVDFRHNPIEQVYAGTFDIMNVTTTLLLGSHKAELKVQPNFLQGLEGLRKLTMRNVVLEVLNQNIMQGVPKLKELHAEGNITSISFDAFTSVPKLEVLILRRCNLKEVSMDSFYGLFGLQILDLSHNRLKTLPPGTFDQLHTLRELQLQNNHLVELPQAIFELVPAKMIRLDNNPWHCSCFMSDWRPMSINKVRVKSKGFYSVNYIHKKLGIQVRQAQYMFDKSVAPRCKTPDKYRDWNVFDVLNKELRCAKLKWRKVSKRKNGSVKKLPPPMAQTISELKDETSIKATSQEVTDKISGNMLGAQTTVEPELVISTTRSNRLVASLELINKPEQATVTSREDSNVLHAMPHDANQGILMKSKKDYKARQKLALLKDKSLKQSSQEEYTIQHEGKVIKVSKKAYQYELERMRMEKNQNKLHSLA